METTKKIVLAGQLAVGLLAFAPAAANAAPWEIDVSHSRVGFTVKHMMVTNTRGEFKKFGGTIAYDEADPTKSSLDIWVDVGSIDTNDEKRDGHLKSPDFFDAAKFPKMTFKSKKVEKAGAGKLKVTGDLTIKDVTKSVTLDVEGPSKALKDPWGGTHAGATATGKINRKDFGLTWNKALEGGGLLVGEDVNLDIEVELVPPAPKK